MKRALLACLCLCTFAAAATTRAQNWSQFHGPNASGVASDAKPTAVKWDATKMEGVRWKTPIPGLAHSSPVVWGGGV